MQRRPDVPSELIGPGRPDVSWPAQHEQASDISPCTIDWHGQRATCPPGKHSASWTPYLDPWDNEVIRVKGRQKDCGACPHRSQCTTAKTAPRHMTIRPASQHLALQQTRPQQTPPEWKARYGVRAGMEGTLSQGLRGFGLRQCRYTGLATTRLQHLATAAAMHSDRLAAWLDGRPHANTRVSRFAALASSIEGRMNSATVSSMERKPTLRRRYLIDMAIHLVCHQTNGYCWRTPKCRKGDLPDAFFEGKKAGKTHTSKRTPRTLK